ncbi:YadA-like family protein [Avibacterium sp. 21-599]|uniref:YadA-like family protein n=1 Tax=Avibacterium sp. 21-599 TaxID=2911528 RepID=UPI0022450E4C|nr:YadA-like family protein [Avibacterium sp. 21-599]MCW9717138.1 YadA-like family protein [Avibacterium sp. 21-599]
MLSATGNVLATNPDSGKDVLCGADGEHTESTNGMGEVACGLNANAAGAASIAIGTSSKASGKNAIAQGNNAQGLAEGSIALGRNASVSGDVGWYVGQEGTFKADGSTNSIAIGTNASIAEGGPNSVAIGSGAKINYTRDLNAYYHDSAGSVAIGYNAEILANDASQGAVAYTDKLPGDNWGSYGGATAVGHNAKTSVGAATALGAARANAIRSIAIGAWGNTSLGKLYAETRSEGSFAIGDQALVDENSRGAQAVGRGAMIIPNSLGAIAFGQGTIAQGNGAVAIGGSTDVSDTELNANLKVPRDNAAVAGAEYAVALAAKAKVYKDSTAGIAIGKDAEVGAGAVEADSTTLVPNKVTGTIIAENGIAIGMNAKALANNAISIGTGNIVRGQNSGALGDPSYISGSGTYTIGNNNGTKDSPIAGDNAGAFGNNNTLTGNNSRIVGNQNNVNVENTFVMGNGVTASQANSVILGNESDDREATTENTALVGHLTYSGFAGQGSADKGVLSVGASDKERQIINVAAGKISSDSTDAINGSQLYAVAKEFDNIPVVYTTTDGTKVYKVGDKFYTTPTPNLDPNNGKVTDALNAKDVVASVQNIDGDANKPTVLRNVSSGLNTITTDGNTKGLLDLTKPATGGVADTTVATVGDLRNMGFVVSSDKTTGDLSTAFSSQVKNAGEVKFVGTGGATVSGKTENGVNTITVAVDVQSVAENAQLPVVYTKNDGTKVYKLANGTFNTQADGKGESVNAENVVASMQNADGSTNKPTTLANIASGIGGNVGNGAGSANTLNQTAGTNSFIDNLTNAKGNTLNKASTVGDLKNLADTPMFFSGDNANKTFARKLSQEVKIQGGQTDESKLTDNNIGVVSNGTDTLTVKLAKNIDLGQDGSVTTGATVVNKDGVKITATDPNNTVSLTNQGLSNGGNQITNVASGLSGGDLASATGATLTNAANIGDLKNVVSNITNAKDGGGFGLKDSAGNEAKQNLGKTITIKGELANNAAASAKNIRVDVANNEVIVKLAEDLTDLNSVTIGKGNNTTKLTSTANGLDVGGDKITNVASGFGSRTPDEIKQAIANGDISPAEKTNAANIGDLLALQNAVQNNVTNVTNNYQNTLGNIYVDNTGKLTEKGKEVLVTYEISGQKERENTSVIDALVQVKEQGTKYFHVNGGQRVEGTKTNSEDASASGAKSTAIGYRADAQGENAIAMGNGAKATGKNSIAIGTGNTVSGEGSGAFGDPTIINGDSSYSVGNNNNIQTNSTYAFGSNITQTIENSVFLGDRSSSNGIHTTANGGNYTYAGANDANVAGVDNVKGVVSVGNANETRQIQHVAAGVVSANSTDAINGSQLYDTHRVINHLNQNVHKMDKDLRAGIAGAAALGMQPQPTRPGKSMVSVGGTSYRNQSAVALGVSRVSDNEKWVIKVGASADTRKNYIVGGAVGYQF